MQYNQATIYDQYHNQAPVLDKVACIFKCGYVKGTTNEKFGRGGEKYLATDVLNPDIKTLVENNIKYVVTAKIDGTCCTIRNGKLMKRRDIKPGKFIPKTWIQTGIDKGKHLIGFMDLEKYDKWYYDAHFKNDDDSYDLTKIKLLRNDNGKMIYEYVDVDKLNGFSVELIGPKFQNNPHNVMHHCIVVHGSIVLSDFPPLTLLTQTLRNDICDWMVTSEKAKFIEGIVVHFENGEKYKLHRHHLDMKWGKSSDTKMSLEDFSFN